MIKLKKDSIVLFDGDSITHGARGGTMDCNHIIGHGYQSIVSSKLAVDNLTNTPRFINKGVSGSTTAQMYSRWEDDVLKFSPDIISILIGTNDCGSVNESNQKEIADNYIKIMDELLTKTKCVLPDTKIIICEPFFCPLPNLEKPYENVPHIMSEDYFKWPNKDISECIKSYKKNAISLMQKSLPFTAKKFDCVYVPMQDIFDEFSKKVSMSYLIWDGTHPTIAGHELIARRWFEVVDKSL